MTKQYRIFRRRKPKPGGGFLEAFHIALVDMSCLGERRFDASGYPYDSEAHALMSDWISIGHDMQNAIRTVAEERPEGGSSEQKAIEERRQASDDPSSSTDRASRRR